MTDKEKELIAQFKKVREEKNLSYSQILEMLENNGDSIAKSTLSRVFKDGSEENDSFRFEDTIRPLARVLLDVDRLEDSDDTDTRAYKSLIQYKSQRIDELERQNEQLQIQIAQMELKFQEKLERERAEWRRRADFMSNQIEKKDSRIDKLMDALFEKDSAYNELLNQYLSCPYSKIGKEKPNDNRATWEEIPNQTNG